jgi:cysteine synthase
MYSRAGSVMMMMMEMEEKIDATTQGEKSVHQFTTEANATAHNHTTLEEVEEVEDKGVDVATEEAENMVDKELLI